MKSWIAVSADSDFPIQNLPFGVFTRAGSDHKRIGVAIGDYILDLPVLQTAGLFDGLSFNSKVFLGSTLNSYMGLNRAAWKEFRALLTAL